eukprot:s3552_g10.t2
MSSSAPCPALQTPRPRRIRESRYEDVKRFVTPLSYRMKKAKQDSEATESTGVGQDDVGSEEDKDTREAVAKAPARGKETSSSQNEASRRRGTEATVKMVNRPGRMTATAAVPGSQVGHSPRVREVSQPNSEASNLSRRAWMSTSGACVASVVATPRRTAGGPARKVRATVVPPSSPPGQAAKDLSATAPHLRMGAYTVAVPVRLPARSQSPSSAHQTPDRPCAVAVATASPATPAVCSIPLGPLGRCSSCEPPRLRRVTVTQSCSAPSLFPAPPTAESAESQSLAQLVIQQLNGPARQEQRCSVVPQRAIPRQLQSSTAVPAEHAVKAAANTQQVHLKDFKPLLRQLFEEESSQTLQSAEQLQSKIDQLQALQQILQVQQRGLKQQQQALQRPPEHRPEGKAASRPACIARSTPRTSVAKGRSGSEGRRRFLL